MWTRRKRAPCIRPCPSLDGVDEPLPPAYVGVDGGQGVSVPHSQQTPKLLQHLTGRGRHGIEADTRGTRDDTVKHLGIASRCAIPLGPGTRMQIRMDWGPPANGSYLAGSIVLSPHATTGDPAATTDWLSIGYVGVPPGRNARLLVMARVKGLVRTLFDDGWPDANRQGRLVERAKIDVAWRGASLEIRENDRLVHTAVAADAPFGSAHVYLQLSSHSNFPARAIHFESVRVEREGDDSLVTGFPAAPECEVGQAK